MVFLMLTSKLILELKTPLNSSRDPEGVESPLFVSLCSCTFS